MKIMRSALVCCLFATVCTAQNHSKIIINAQHVELEGRGMIDLASPDDFEALLTALYELCDYYNTCNNPVYVPEHDRQFLASCVPCDCSDNCYVTGNCCRDKAGETRAENKMNEYGEVCTKTHPLDTDDVTYSHLLVSQCHPEYEGDAKMKCESNTDESMDFVTPVYTLMGGLAYSNIHCARCNFQNASLEQWDMFMSCANYTPIRQDGGLYLAVEKGCRISTRPPNPFIPECYTESSVAECGRARYNTLCGTVRQGYGYVNALRNNMCFFMDICAVDTSSTSNSSFDAVIDLKVFTSDVSLSVEPQICQDGKGVNDTEGKCLHVTCAPSKFMVKEREQRCTDLFTLVRGVCLDYRLRITITPSNGASFGLLETALSEITLLLFPDNPFQKPFVIDYSTTNGSVTYKIQIVDELIRYAFVNNRLLELETKLHNASSLIPGVHVEEITDGNAFQSQALEEIGYLSYKGLQKQGCNKMVAMSSMQTCQMVMFAQGEYRTSRGVIMLMNGREFQPHEYVFRQSLDGKRHVQICLETYLSRKGKHMTRSLDSGCKMVTMNDMSKLVMFMLAESVLSVFLKI